MLKLLHAAKGSWSVGKTGADLHVSEQFCWSFWDQSVILCTKLYQTVLQMHICVSQYSLLTVITLPTEKLPPLCGWWNTRCHWAFHMNYCDFSLFLPFRWISVKFHSFLWDYITVVNKLNVFFFFTALQTPSSCVMNNGGKFHLTLQQFPSALIVLGKQQSLHAITEIVPH